MGKVIPMSGDGAEKRPTRGPSMNQVVLCGRLVADPRVHVKPDGLHISEVRIVTNDRQESEYHDVVTYRRLAEQRKIRSNPSRGTVLVQAVQTLMIIG